MGRTETPASAAGTGSSAGASVAPAAPPTPRVEPSTAPAGLGPKESEASLGLERPERRLIQEGLASLGFSPGPADGLFGRRTREAIRQYQGEKGFTETGYLSADEAQALVEVGKESHKVEAERREQERRAEEERRERERQAKEKRAADRRADDEAYARAKREDTAAAYKAYLARGGRHEAEVRRRLAELSRSRSVGEVFRDCAHCPEMVVVPAGSFMMGSPVGESGRYEDEGPVHQVRIMKPFAVGVYEVTRGQWSVFVSETDYSTGNSCSVLEEWGSGTIEDRHWRNPGFSQTNNHPVVCVNWRDAQAYVHWLSKETGAKYRLLSESEWEYVARGGTKTARYWGESNSGLCPNANGGDGSAGYMWFLPKTCNDDGHPRTAPVGSYTGNKFGLYDVLGNVMEWVEDCWNESYDKAPTDGSAWEKGNCNERVVRGGSWGHGWSRMLRSAVRAGATSSVWSSASGFRVARTLVHE